MEKALLKNVYIHINSILLNQYWIIIILLIKTVKSKNVILIVNIVVLNHRQTLAPIHQCGPGRRFF